ncbi:MAG: hypothetical protein VR78_06560 [Hoeflea sp. BRH_c9]|nr:MAG: hypothetical protein VR78_06560 [Hoeflea sp. BRH_c9]
MSPVLLFGGTSRERLVSVASAQALAGVLRHARLWFWDAEDAFTEVARDELLAHEQPFEISFRPAGQPFARDIGSMLDAASAGDHVLVLALHGGDTENGVFAARCEERRVPFTGSGAAASRTAFEKPKAKDVVQARGLHVAPSLQVANPDEASDGRVAAWLKRYKRLVAKPAADGSSCGLLFIDRSEDIARVTELASSGIYLVEPFLSGVEVTVGVAEWDGGAEALPPVEIRPVAGRVFDYAGKYLGQGVSEICPAQLPAKCLEELKRSALVAHKALGAFGYSRTDFIVTEEGPIFLELNTLPGLTTTSLFPLALKTAGRSLEEFLGAQQRLARGRYQHS